MKFSGYQKYENGTYYFDFRSKYFGIWCFSDCGPLFIYWYFNEINCYRLMFDNASWWELWPISYMTFSVSKGNRDMND